MFTKNNHSPIKYMFSKQLNLSDFGLEKKTKNYIKKFQKTNNKDINQNKLIKFIEYTFNYANICLPRYSSYFSNHIYTQPVLSYNTGNKSLQSNYLSTNNRLITIIR